MRDTSRRVHLGTIALVLVTLSTSVRGGPGAGVPPGDTAMQPSWTQVERLVSEQKYQAALDQVEGLVARARETGDAAGWTRGLVEATQLRTALHGYETAVRELGAAAWPDEPLERTVLELYTAQSIVHYVQAYAWEIDQRERVAGEGEPDLGQLTRPELFAAANAAYQRAWSQRAGWGETSLGRLAPYFEANDYPAHVRGTLRDAVSYLWVELLTDTGFWRPEEQNDLFRLSVGELVALDPADAAAIVDEPGGHPLRRAIAVLADLSAWHEDGVRPEAGFEARRSALAALAATYSREEDQTEIRSALDAGLDRLGSQFAWWSYGRADLAELVRRSSAPDREVRARELALGGSERHPGSLGGRRCRQIVAAIEAPSFELQGMQSDGLDRRSLRIRHRNVARLVFRAYPLDLERRLRTSRAHGLLPDGNDVVELLDKGEPALTWEVELPAVGDYRIHATDVTPPIDQPGLWVVVASARDDFSREHNQLASVALLIGDPVLLVRDLDEGLEATVRSGTDGATLAGARVRLFRADWRTGHQVVASATTGADGRVLFELPESRRDRYVIVADRRGSHALSDAYRFRATPSVPDRTGALVFTDRSAYRPGQRLHWKVAAYEREGPEAYRTSPDRTVEVELVDPNGETVAHEEVTTNGFGTASGTFEVTRGRLLGGWFLRTSLGGHTPIRVEEYKRPTFEVTLGDPDEPTRLNRPVELSGEARYYFGLPVVAGDVRYTVTREPVYPRWWFWTRPRSQTQTIAAGTTILGEEGRFPIRFTPEADERDRDQPGLSYRYRLTVEVTDEGGETRSADRVYRLGFAAIEASIESGDQFALAGEPVALTIRRTDLDGHPRAGVGRWELFGLDLPGRTLLPAEQPLFRPPGSGDPGEETEGDRTRTRWDPGYEPFAVLASWATSEKIRSGDTVHGPDGPARLDLPPLEGGAYRLVYRTLDPDGHEVEARYDLVVADPGGTELPLPGLLLVQRDSVEVGGVARVLVHSGLPDQPLTLARFRRTARTDERQLTSGDGLQLVEIPVGPEDRGGFGLALTLVRDHQLVRLGRTVEVPWTDRTLEVELSTFRDRLRPGDRESWRVTVRDGSGAPVEAGAAEVLALMYDRSLELFAPYALPSVSPLYPTLAGVVFPTASLGASSARWRWDRRGDRTQPIALPHGDRLRFLAGYGIGGLGRRGLMVARMEMMAAPESAEAVSLEVEGSAVEAGEGIAKKIAIPDPTPDEGTPAEDGVRTDFSETAFFEPHLLTGEDGAVSFEFTVPDSVTEWSVWAQALTRDLRGGSVEGRTRTVKELLVRPYLPRFLREGDRVEIAVVVQNAGDEPLEGTLDLTLTDPETGASRLDDFGLAPTAAEGRFAVAPGGSARLAFPIEAPRGVGEVDLTVRGEAGSWSDGERRPLPLLPSRLHLVQSRFAAVQEGTTRELAFPDLEADDDPTRESEQLVATLDGQLFVSVLAALPYLVEYPYECTEQTLNRFVSTGILSSVYASSPAVATMAASLAERETPLERWDEPDPNRSMALAETPWLVSSRGGEPGAGELLALLDPELAEHSRDRALTELREAQTSSGGFPWWPGGPPSPYMTLYLLSGFSRALEFGIDIPRDVVQRAWSYLHAHYVEELVRDRMAADRGWETITFFAYVLSSYPDEGWTGGVFPAQERREMLDFSMRHWREHAPLGKAQLALALHRAGRTDEARLVFDSVMDSARTDPDLGTFWAPEAKAWLWYQDTTETHAFALRTLTELAPEDERRYGIVQWLFLDKKLAHWKSTRATAEVIYSLVHHLRHEGTLGDRQEATLRLGSRVHELVFDPAEIESVHQQIVLPGAEVEPSASPVVVENEGPGLLFASATWHFATDELPAESRGDLLSIERRFFRREHDGEEWTLTPLAPGESLAPGDQIEVQLTVRAKHAAEYVHLRDPRGAGFEPESLHSRHQWKLGVSWYEEVRDSGTSFFFERLPAGEYPLTHRLRAAHAGIFRVGPATLQSMYAPEFTAYSSGVVLTVEGGAAEE